MENNVPADLRAFQLDLRNANAVTVDYSLGKGVQRESCNQRGPDQVGVVIELSLVIAYGGSSRARLYTVPLAQALRVDVESAMGSPVNWTRSPQGIWLRYHNPW